MTKDQLVAIETVLAHLYDTGFPDSLSSNIRVLDTLLQEAKQAYYAFDASKAELVAFMTKWDLTIPAAEFDGWRMVIPRNESLGSLLVCPKCRTTHRYGSGLTTEESLRPERCSCGEDLTPVASKAVLADKAIVGQICGLPQSHGTLRATNGILCYIEQARGVFLGHVEFFEVDEAASEPTRVSHNGKPKKLSEASGVEKYLEGLFA